MFDLLDDLMERPERRRRSRRGKLGTWLAGALGRGDDDERARGRGAWRRPDDDDDRRPSRSGTRRRRDHSWD